MQGGALVAGVSNVKQEVPVQVKKERAVTVVCSHGHDLVKSPGATKADFLSRGNKFAVTSVAVWGRRLFCL